MTGPATLPPARRLTTEAELEALPPWSMLIGFSTPEAPWLPDPLPHAVRVSSDPRRLIWAGPGETAAQVLACFGGEIWLVYSPQATP